MMLRLIVVFFVWAGLASAQELPVLHDVVGVASDDVLNIRQQPKSGTPIVGELAYDAGGVEVLRRQGNWGLVNTDEGSGWAYMRYLRPWPSGGTFPDAAVFECYGTEPFWDLYVEQGNVARLNSITQLEPLDFSIGGLENASGFNRKWALFGQGGGDRLTLLTRALTCSDGMTDREFGIDATMFIEAPNGEMQILSGCCEMRGY